MGGVEAAPESGAAGADQERDLRCGLAELGRASGQPPLRVGAAGHRERVGGVGRDLPALLRRVGHGEEDAYLRASSSNRVRRPSGVGMSSSPRFRSSAS